MVSHFVAAESLANPYFSHFLPSHPALSRISQLSCLFTLTAGKFGISGQRETSACPGLKNEPAFQQARLMEPFSLQCSVSIRCTLRQKFLRLLFVLQFGWYSYSTTGCSTSLRSGTAAYRVRPSSFKTCGAARDSGSLLFSFQDGHFRFCPCAILTSVCMPESSPVWGS